jgi:hypothetical protein
MTVEFWLRYVRPNEKENHILLRANDDENAKVEAKSLVDLLEPKYFRVEKIIKENIMTN